MMDDNRMEETQGQTLEKALQGDYHLPIGLILTEAWTKIRGMKAAVFGASVALMFISAIIFIAMAFIGASVSALIGKVLGAGIGVVLTVIAMGVFMPPLTAGYSMLGMFRAVDLPISMKLIFHYFRYLLPFLGITVVIYIFANLLPHLINWVAVYLLEPALGGVSVIALSCVIAAMFMWTMYLRVALMFSYLLMIEKRLGVMQSIKFGCKAVSRHWFQLFFLLLVVGIISGLVVLVAGGLGALALFVLGKQVGMFILAVALLGSGVWLMPWLVNVVGITYRYIFGINKGALTE